MVGARSSAFRGLAHDGEGRPDDMQSVAVVEVVVVAGDTAQHVVVVAAACVVVPVADAVENDP